MKKATRIDNLHQAIELIHEAVGLIRWSVDGTEEEGMANAYIIPHLENWAEGNNPYDHSLPRIIENLENEYEDPED